MSSRRRHERERDLSIFLQRLRDLRSTRPEPKVGRGRTEFARAIRLTEISEGCDGPMLRSGNETIASSCSGEPGAPLQSNRGELGRRRVSSIPPVDLSSEGVDIVPMRRS